MKITVKELLESYFSDSNASIDDEYQEIFAEEGERKTEYIRDYLSSIEERQPIDISEYIYVSIGGADGSEVESMLQKTKLKYGVVIEYSDAGSDRAREKARKLKAIGKHLKVFQGDAMQRLPDCLEHMISLKKSGEAVGAIVSCQAVLHELPKRSPSFREDKFWAQMLSVFTHNAVVIREPMEGERWNRDEVYIKIDNVSSTDLKKIAEIINDKLQITNEHSFVAADNFLALDSQLALETLHKVLRANSVDEFKYELGERLTSFSPEKTRKIIESHLGSGTVRVESFNTDGFIDAWNSNDVRVKDKEGVSLSIPTTHCRLLGVSKWKPENCSSESDLEWVLKVTKQRASVVYVNPSDRIQELRLLNEKNDAFLKNKEYKKLIDNFDECTRTLGDLSYEDFSSEEELRLSKALFGIALMDYGIAFLKLSESQPQDFPSLYAKSLEALKSFLSSQYIKELDLFFGSLSKADRVNILYRCKEYLQWMKEYFGDNFVANPPPSPPFPDVSKQEALSIRDRISAAMYEVNARINAGV